VSGIEGKPVYAIFSYRWAGLDPQTGNPQGYVEGNVSQDYAAIRGASTQISDLKYHGSAIPTCFGSLGNTFTYRDFALTASITYKLGYFFRRQSVNYGLLYRNGDGNADFENRWQQPGDESFTNVPSMIYPANTNRDGFYAGSEVLVERGDHIRFQYITASYDFTNTAWKGLPFKHLQTYVNINNLGLLWAANRHGIDPDFQNRFAIPTPRSYALGLKTTF
jgi:hypothetical protein